MSEVYVTGIGIICSLGNGIDSVFHSLFTGENGIRHYNSTFHETIIAAPVIEPDFKQYSFDKKEKKIIRNMDLSAKMLLYVFYEALRNANFILPLTEKVGAITGNGTALADRYDQIEQSERNPLWFLETYPNLPLGYVSNIVNLNGLCSTIVSACSSGIQAIGEAYRNIKSGYADIMVGAAVDNKLSKTFIQGFQQLNMSTKDRNPDAAMRPFDKLRSGFVIGQGACALVMESAKSVKKRGAEPLCRVAGYGASMNNTNATDASAPGMERAMRDALLDGHITDREIDYINAHGTSTISNDREESIAIKNVFGKRAYDIPVSSTKSMIGHTFAASGAIESAICIKSLQTQKIHMTRNFETGDNDCNLDYVKEKGRKVVLRYCLNNSSGIGGYNASLVLAGL